MQQREMISSSNNTGMGDIKKRKSKSKMEEVYINDDEEN